jgi:hypothetical protein
MLQNSVGRMAGLIDNVLDFALGRLGDGLTLDRSVRDVGPVVRQVVAELQTGNPSVKNYLSLDVRQLHREGLRATLPRCAQVPLWREDNRVRNGAQVERITTRK